MPARRPKTPASKPAHSEPPHPPPHAQRPRRIAVTGGPGAGKTALLAVARHTLGERAVVLPEAATILFSGGFPRHAEPHARRAAQRAIFHVQRELEAVHEHEHRVLLCDRGTIDGVAYWPDAAHEYWSALGTTHEAELARYYAVLHLRTPAEGRGYDHRNPARVESAREAALIDGRIERAWAAHPRRVCVDNEEFFTDKVLRALNALKALLDAPA